MKIIPKLIFLLALNFSCIGQNSGKEYHNLVFIDNCSNLMIDPEFEILKDQERSYDFITIYKKTNDWTLQYATSLKSQEDTIRIPKILFASGSELHSKRWTYFNCDRICSGTETDYYKNGNKRIEGTFENGKPYEIREYWENGNLQVQTFFENLTLNLDRVNYYDENGALEEYLIYHNKKKRTIIKTFDKDGNLIGTEIEK